VMARPRCRPLSENLRPVRAARQDQMDKTFQKQQPLLRPFSWRKFDQNFSGKTRLLLSQTIEFPGNQEIVEPTEQGINGLHSIEGKPHGSAAETSVLTH
jgi:hypothetical protein